MRQHTMLFVSLVAGTVLFASACSDTTQPMPSSDDKVGFGPIQQPDDPVALVRDVHGFGGFFFDRDGAPTVYLRDVSARAQVERALGPWLASQGIGVAALRVRGADYDWASLERWQGRATGEALAMRGAVWVDADEARNRVTIGVERGTRSSRCHRRLLPSPPRGFHSSGKPVSSDAEICWGPRQLGQSMGSGSAANETLPTAIEAKQTVSEKQRRQLERKLMRGMLRL